MKSMCSSLMLPLLIMAFYSCGNAQNWQKLAPLRSTRAQVEAILGAAPGAYSGVYQLRDGSLFVEYSSGPCSPGRKGGWNVPENVVVSLSFSPRHKQRVADLKIDSRKFRKRVDQHVIGIIYYINEEDGITYEIQDGKVELIEYYPPRKYDNFYCGKFQNDR